MEMELMVDIKLKEVVKNGREKNKYEGEWEDCDPTHISQISGKHSAGKPASFSST